MNKFNLSYSEKNIPIPSTEEYKLLLINKTENFIKRMRWKAIAFLKDMQGTTKETYGFRTRRCPSAIQELKAFETDLVNMCQNLEFNSDKNDFQREILNDAKKIKECNDVIIPADKSRNFYKMDKVQYNQHLNNSITSTYKRCTANQVNIINRESAAIAEKLDIADRVEKLQETNSYITIKDHKPNFENNPSFRLINPSKTELGKISKRILDNINLKIKENCDVTQWKNTGEVIKWFNSITNKDRCKFINFDIEAFYPNITEELTRQAIEWVRINGIPVSTFDVDIIMQARKTLLFSDNKPWIKRSGAEFDVPMGCYDGAEICEMVGAFLLHKIKSEQIFKNGDIGLYRDDGLGIVYNTSGPELEKCRKRLCELFKKYKLGITTDFGLNSVNFLDITLNLSENTFKPYMKPNSSPVYVHKKSNHPPNVIRDIPVMINKRLSDLSKNEELFDETKPEYEEALKRSGYDVKLKYTPTPENSVAENSAESSEDKRSRKRKIIWYNPPYSQSVKTNIGKKFFNLIQKHFPSDSPLAKIFNKNTIKLSYCCTKNIGDIISGHNKKVLSPPKETHGCNCRVKKDCPLENNCMITNVVYKATVTNNINNEVKFYIGCTDNFKPRWTNHKMTFLHKKYKNSTELSSYVHNFTNRSDVDVKFEIIRSVKNKIKYGFCGLCLAEKLEIFNNMKDPNLLNNFHIVTPCLHQKSTLLSAKNLGFERFANIIK